MRVSDGHSPALLCLAAMALIGCHASGPQGVTPARQREAEHAARQAIAVEQRVSVDTFPARSLGITPFEVDAADTAVAPLAFGLADLLTTDLARSRQLQVVDRLRLEALLRELQLVEAGRVDTATAPRVGRLVGARRLVLGALQSRPGGALDLTVRLADVASGEVRQSVAASAPLANILQAEKELAFRLFGALGVTLSPAERSAVEQMPTKNLAALLAYSRGVRYEVEGRFEEAAREYHTAARMDPGFTAAVDRSQVLPAAAPSPSTAVVGRSGQVDRAATSAVEQINSVFFSPIGDFATTPLAESGIEPPSTVTVIISVGVP
jgi:TolB-like protein